LGMYFVQLRVAPPKPQNPSYYYNHTFNNYREKINRIEKTNDHIDMED